jgi:inhibitor of cysteine peptidase
MVLSCNKEFTPTNPADIARRNCMKRLLFTVLTFLLATGLAGGREGIADQLKKEAGPSSFGIGQTGKAGGPLVENPMTDETDSGKANITAQLDVTVGQEFNITLASNATTGYHWELAARLDEAVVKLVTSEYKAPETRMLGAGGQEIWTFKAVSRGQTVVSLKYVRPWEKDVAPEKTASYTVTVH